jgi:CTP synthase
MREIGIQPDILVCRSDRPLARGIKEKIALFSNVKVDSVIAAADVAFIYELPLVLHAEGLDDQLIERLNIWSRQPDLSAWHQTCERFKKPSKGAVRIGVVGKYVHLRDSYKSLHEALIHGGLASDARVDLEYVDSEVIEKNGAEATLQGLDGVLVPGGFGDRGVSGKIEAVRFARENRIPFFGICLGMQLAVVEFARNKCGLKGANSTEFDRNTQHPVIDLMPDQRAITDKGGTMRLGAYPCIIKAGSLANRIYGSTDISERHRHRYEFANAFREQVEAQGLVLSGTSPDKRLVEMVELPDHPYYVACQFHPEFKSRVMAPHPLFTAFIGAALEYRTAQAAKNAESKLEPGTVAVN